MSTLDFILRIWCFENVVLDPWVKDWPVHRALLLSSVFALHSMLDLLSRFKELSSSTRSTVNTKTHHMLFIERKALHIALLRSDVGGWQLLLVSSYVSVTLLLFISLLLSSFINVIDLHLLNNCSLSTRHSVLYLGLLYQILEKFHIRVFLRQFLVTWLALLLDDSLVVTAFQFFINRELNGSGVVQLFDLDLIILLLLLFLLGQLLRILHSLW